jgi:PAS domain S-box-containing protein
MHWETIWEERNRSRGLIASGSIVLIIAIVDWRTGANAQLGLLYAFPITIAASFLPRWAVALIGLVCAALSALFRSLDISSIRLAFEFLALAGCGLFVGEWLRNRRVSMEERERLRALVETSPAAMVTVDERGLIELANRAAHDLMLPRDRRLVGNPIAAFFPELHYAVVSKEAQRQRTSLHCRGRLGNGESFRAQVWCSSYQERASPKLAAIITEVGEEPVATGSSSAERRERAGLSGRETEVLCLLVQGLANKEIAARMDMSESTVKNAIRQLFAKTNVRTRTQLVKMALERYRDLVYVSAGPRYPPTLPVFSLGTPLGECERPTNAAARDVCEGGRIWQSHDDGPLEPPGEVAFACRLAIRPAPVLVPQIELLTAPDGDRRLPAAVNLAGRLISRDKLCL